ncbi:MAG: M23 family metallopeptidase [Actinobacteria bacterium]|nr:MAG: M23 family metallopeptidase [Actinomycetota bacterium]
MPPSPLRALAALLAAALIWPAAAGAAAPRRPASLARLVTARASSAARAPSPSAGRSAPRWRAPVDGPVVARFTYARAHPFGAGQRRGVEFAAAPGSLVIAPCDGRVVFSGRLPRFGAAVSIRCRDGLVATVLELAGASVRRATSVDAGRRLGTVGAGGHLRLGARRGSDRFGYRDPLALLAPPDRPPRPALPRRPTLGPAPRGTPPRLPAPARPPAAAPLRPARAAFAPAPPAAPRDAPLAAWLGAGLIATALGAGGTARIARRRRAARRLGAALSRAASGG